MEVTKHIYLCPGTHGWTQPPYAHPTNLLLPEFKGARPLSDTQHTTIVLVQASGPPHRHARTIPRPATQQACSHTSPPWGWEALPGTRTHIPSPQPLGPAVIAPSPGSCKARRGSARPRSRSALRAPSPVAAQPGLARPAAIKRPLWARAPARRPQPRFI